MNLCECGKPAHCRGMCQAHYYRVLRAERRARRGLPLRPKLQSAEAMRLDPEDPRHGTQGGYTNCRCRCARCRSAQAEGMRHYRNREAS